MHWWQCGGSCQHRPPYFGLVKRAQNRPPSPRDPWWNRVSAFAKFFGFILVVFSDRVSTLLFLAQHQSECGGSYTKVKEPEGYGKPKAKSKVPAAEASSSSSKTTPIEVALARIPIKGRTQEESDRHTPPAKRVLTTTLPTLHSAHL